MDFGKLSDRFLAEGADSGAAGLVEDEMASDSSEPLDGSLTNELVLTQVGTVLKRFSKRPGMSYVQMMGRVPGRRLERQNQLDRIENEKAFRGFISGYDVEVPDILGVSGEYMEFEHLEGEDLNDYLDENPDEAEQYGREVAEFLNYVHSNDGAITDLRLNNFRVRDSDDMAFLDAEYFVEDAREWEKEMDMITLENSLRQISGEAYTGFREGFDEEYGDRIGERDERIASVTSPGHAAILERDYERFRNSVSNLRY